LQAAQETRTTAETITGIAAQTILSGILGGAVGHLTSRELQQLEKGLNETSAMATIMSPGSLGAAAKIDVPDWAGQIASGGVTATRLTDSNPLTRNPVTYNVRQPMRTVVEGGKPTQVPVDYLRSSVARSTTLQMSDGGLRFMGHEFGVPTAPGGTIEMRIQTHYNTYPAVVQQLDDAFLDYRFE